MLIFTLIYWFNLFTIQSQNIYPRPEVFIDFKDPDMITSEPVDDTKFVPEPKIQVICFIT